MHVHMKTLNGALLYYNTIPCLDARDVSASPRVQPRPTDPIRPFQITLPVDGISQEFNETFSIELTGFDLGDVFLFPDALVTVNSLAGTIIDQDSKYLHSY